MMHATRAKQRGLGLLSLLFWAVVVAFFGVLAARVLPTVMEYYTIQAAIERIARGDPASVQTVRAEFERIKQIEYSIKSIGPGDLTVEKVNDKTRISFAYEKQVEVAGPVFLLIKYQGQSR